MGVGVSVEVGVGVGVVVGEQESMSVDSIGIIKLMEALMLCSSFFIASKSTFFDEQMD